MKTEQLDLEALKKLVDSDDIVQTIIIIAKSDGEALTIVDLSVPSEVTHAVMLAGFGSIARYYKEKATQPADES